MDDTFFELTEELAAELDAARRSEERAEAAEIVAAALQGRRFVDHLRRLGPGERVTVVTVDGACVQGRLLAVAADWCCVGEVTDDLGTARRRVVRVHDVPLGAIVRVSREPEPGVGW